MSKVIVTGGRGALGAAIVKELRARGHDVAVVDCVAEGDASTSDDLYMNVDLLDEQAVARAYDEIVSRFGDLHAVVNVAGGFVWEMMENGSVGSLDRMFQINLRTVYISSQKALPFLLATGESAIVNVGAAAANAPGAGMAPYAASKAGVRALTEGLSAELRDRGVRVNAILPTILDTPANRKDMPDADTSQWVRPEGAAKAVAFLISPDAAAITGACIPLSLPACPSPPLGRADRGNGRRPAETEWRCRGHIHASRQRRDGWVFLRLFRWNIATRPS